MLQRVVVVTGEPSGDLLGSHLARELQRQVPGIEIEGVFGKQMIHAGCTQLASMDTLSVMGFIEPIIHLPKILKLRAWLLRYILENPPDLFIGIDAPDFNLGLELKLRQAGITTVHYVSPSVWAWRRGRIKTIAKATDLMLTLFPFEQKFYEQHQIPVAYTGHPTADLVPMLPDTYSAKEELGYSADDKVLAVLIGSRNSELKNMSKLYIKTMLACYNKEPSLKFLVPLLYAGHQEYFEHWRAKLAPQLVIKYVVNNSYLAMRACDIALVTSGTATLELMLHKKPMIIAYRTSMFTYFLAKLLVKLEHIGLPNLMAGGSIVPEYIQYAATPDSLSSALLELLMSNELQDKQVQHFTELHRQLQQGAASQAAAAILRICNYDNSRS